MEQLCIFTPEFLKENLSIISTEYLSKKTGVNPEVFSVLQSHKDTNYLVAEIIERTYGLDKLVSGAIDDIIGKKKKPIMRIRTSNETCNAEINLMPFLLKTCSKCCGEGKVIEMGSSDPVLCDSCYGLGQIRRG